METEALPEHEGSRLDQFLAASEADLSRSRVQKLISEGQVFVNGNLERSSYRIVPGDKVRFKVPEPVPARLDPEEISLDVFYEDNDLLVVNKPAGMVVHPARGVRSGTLVNALLAHCENLSGINGELRPGIVHRLDKDTSGLLMVAKGDLAHRGLAGQLEARTVFRRYFALVWGHFKKGVGKVEAPIGRHRSDRKRMAVQEDEGRLATTSYEMDTPFDYLTSLWLRLESGRTHQIRVHLSHIGHPVFGDLIYGGRETQIRGIAPQYRRNALELLKIAPRQMLHAEALGFTHPVTGKEMRFRADLPDDMAQILAGLSEE